MYIDFHSEEFLYELRGSGQNGTAFTVTKAVVSKYIISRIHTTVDMIFAISHNLQHKCYKLKFYFFWKAYVEEDTSPWDL